MKDIEHISLDIETLDTTPSAFVLSIGAVYFDPRSEQLGESYHAVLYRDKSTQISAGRTVSQDTSEWWQRQSAQARSVFDPLHINQIPVLAAMDDLRRFVRKGARVWGYGADFDNVIVLDLCRSLKLPEPWDWWNNRCLRTLEDLVPMEKDWFQPSGVPHIAIDDAINQARKASALLRKIGAYA